MLRKILISVLTLLLIAVLGWGGSWALSTHFFTVESVNLIAGDSQHVTLVEQVRQSILDQLKAVRGQSIFSLSLEDLRQMTLRDARVRDVAVFRRFPSTLEVQFKVHEPSFLLWTDNGHVIPVARDASLLPSIPIIEAPNLMIVRGKELHGSKPRREQLSHLIDQIPSKGLFSRSSISEVMWMDKGYFKMHLSQGETIWLSLESIKTKVGMIERVLNYLDQHQMRGRVIDARYSKKVVVRLRNES